MRRYTVLLIPIALLCISFLVWRKQPTTLPIIENTHQQSASANQSGYFDSLTKELSLDSLKIEGKLPSWLSGDFYFIGPALFELGQTRMKYWFNGLGMLHTFSIKGKKASYSNAFCKGLFYNECIKNNAFNPSMTPNYKKPSFFSGLSNAFATPKPYDNANINVIQLGDELCAATETPHSIIFDQKTLESQHHFKYKDSLQGHLATAQPLYDKDTKQWYNIMTELGKTSYYQIYTFDEQTHKRHCVCKIPTKNPAYIRSFGLTDTYFILIETPCIIKPMDLAFGMSFLDALSWNPKYGVTITLIDKRTGVIKKTLKTRSFFMFNVINAFELNNDIIVDCITYNNPNVIGKTQVSYLRSNKVRNESSVYTRLHLDLIKENITCSAPYNNLIEMPTINPDYQSSKYCYCYAVTTPNAHTFPGQIIKLDVQSGKAQTWDEPNCFASKPIFIARPDGSNEDDGMLVSVVYNNKTSTSSLVAIDAQSMKKVASIALPHHLPFGVNGMCKRIV